MTAPHDPHDPHRPQRTGPHANYPHANYRAQYPAPYVTSTPHVLRGDRNGPGIVGLAMGIIALCLAVVPFVGVVAWVLWPVAVILSRVGLNRVNRGEANNRATALAGLIVSLTAAAVCLAWVVFTVAATADGAEHQH